MKSAIQVSGMEYTPTLHRGVINQVYSRNLVMNYIVSAEV
jgi:hypothetical protein